MVLRSQFQCLTPILQGTADTVEELKKQAFSKVHTIDVANLEKRVRSLRTVFWSFRSNPKYTRELANRLWLKCVSASRSDLAFEVELMLCVIFRR